MYDAYCTLAQVRAETRSAAGADDLYLVTLIGQISRRFARLAGMDFEPRRETRLITPLADVVESGTGRLRLDAPLLELISVACGGRTLLIGVDVAADGDSADRPASALRLLRTGASWYDGAHVVEHVSVGGVWGWRTRHALEGWLTVDSLAEPGGLSADATLLHVTDANGTDPFGAAPRFSPGALLRLDDEFMRVTAVDPLANALTVRGWRGTTAAVHDSGVPVAVWQVEDDVRRAVIRWTALAYARRGVFETAGVGGLASLAFPADAPAEVRAVAGRYAWGLAT